MTKPLRADARRNRERVLIAAREAFAAEGPGVSLDDIARRAGVGPGTVHRHFPTKDALFTAVIIDRLSELASEARDLAGAAEPGTAFFTFLDQLAEAARNNVALQTAFTDSNELHLSLADTGAALEAALTTLLTQAQRAGAVRTDIDVRDLHAVMSGALAIDQRASTPGRGMSIVVDGLRPR
jgi:AcrR family transcriptional regulator